METEYERINNPLSCESYWPEFAGHQNNFVECKNRGKNIASVKVDNLDYNKIRTHLPPEHPPIAYYKKPQIGMYLPFYSSHEASCMFPKCRSSICLDIERDPQKNVSGQDSSVSDDLIDYTSLEDAISGGSVKCDQQAHYDYLDSIAENSDNKLHDKSKPGSMVMLYCSTCGHANGVHVINANCEDVFVEDCDVFQRIASDPAFIFSNKDLVIDAKEIESMSSCMYTNGNIINIRDGSVYDKDVNQFIKIDSFSSYNHFSTKLHKELQSLTQSDICPGGTPLCKNANGYINKRELFLFPCFLPLKELDCYQEMETLVSFVWSSGSTSFDTKNFS